MADGEKLFNGNNVREYRYTFTKSNKRSKRKWVWGRTHATLVV